MQSLILASGNPGKLKEFQQLLAGAGFKVQPQSDYDVPECDETGLTFIENAILKARNACIYTGLPSIADDSGLAVDALNGAPGIYSSRFGGSDATDNDNNQLLLEKMRLVPDELRGARFHCVLAFMRHENDPTPMICHGSWEGKILKGASGTNGFGYDPLFYLSEHKCTSAELEPAEKNRLSHRARAMDLLLNQMQNKILDNI